MSVDATYAVFERYTGEKMEPPGPWRDTGIRSDDPEKARAEWLGRKPEWNECDVRLVSIGPTAENLATRRRTIDLLKSGVTPIGAFATAREPVEFDNELVEVGPGHEPQGVATAPIAAAYEPGDRVALSVYQAEVERVAERDRIIARLRSAAGVPDTTSAETLATHIAKLREACDKSVTIGALQREAAAVNEQQGVIAFLVGVLARIRRADNLHDAQCYAEAGEVRLRNWNAGTWKPGPHDDPADWPPRWRPAPEPSPALTASEALFGFAGWLTTRDEQTIMSARDNASPIAALVKRFCEENKLTPPRDGWHRLLKHPSDTKADSAGLGWVDRGFARASSPVRQTGVLEDQTWVAFRSEPDYLAGEAILRDGRIVTVERDTPSGLWRVREAEEAGSPSTSAPTREDQRSTGPAARTDQAGGPVPRSAEQLSVIVAANLGMILGNHVKSAAFDRRRPPVPDAPIPVIGWYDLQPDDVIANLHLWERLGTAQAALGALKGYSGTARGFVLDGEKKPATTEVIEEPSRYGGFRRTTINHHGQCAPTGGKTRCGCDPIVTTDHVFPRADAPSSQPIMFEAGRTYMFKDGQVVSVPASQSVPAGAVPLTSPPGVWAPAVPGGIDSGAALPERRVPVTRAGEVMGLVDGREQPEAGVVAEWHIPASAGAEGRHVVAVADAPRPLPNANAAIEDAVQRRMVHGAAPMPEPAVPVAAMPGFRDRLCRCDKCPLGRIGAMPRCTETELRAAGVAVQVVDPEPADLANVLKDPYDTTGPTPDQVAKARAELERDQEIVLRGPEAAAYRELQAASLAVEETHAANQDAQRVHQAKAVALSRLLAEAGRKGRAP